jgi:uncharacterized repeat protein (TIGR01451 family)
MKRIPRDGRVIFVFTRALPAICVALGVAALASAATHGKYYELVTIAKTGEAGLVGMGDNPSINNFGDVAFVGQLAGGEGLFVGNGLAPAHNITPGFLNPSRVWGRSAQINDSRQVIARDRVSGAPPITFVRVWDGTTTDSYTIYAAGGLPTSSYDSVSSHPTINNRRDAAFGAFTGASDFLISAVPVGLPSNVIAELPVIGALRPMIANDGRIIVRRGTEIVLFNQNLTAPVVLASSPGFTSVGQSPGISDDGVAAAFYADIDASTASALRTAPGPGIFVSLETGPGTRERFRVDHRMIEAMTSPGNRDDQCDAGETCIPDVVGMDDAGHVVSLTFEKDSRVGVIHQSLGAPGLDGDSLTIAFLGTPDFGSFPINPFRGSKKALWTVRVDLNIIGGRLTTRVFRPVPVTQVDDKVDGDVIKDIAIFDPLGEAGTDDLGTPRSPTRGDHRVVFWAQTAAGARIIRGTQLDTDQDGLLDHWETSGIDFDGDLTVDFLLGTKPRRKDLLLEVDFMETAGGLSARPFDAALNAVVAAFAAAPVSNPDGTTGITLRFLSGGASPADEAVPVQPVILVKGRAPGLMDDFNDYKIGNNGTGGAMPCGAGPGTGFFGASADRASANCLNIIGARRLVTHYSIFGFRFSEVPGGPPVDASGDAETPGSDHFISVAAFGPALLKSVRGATCLMRENALDCGKREIQAATFMHEFGHTLGLRHGGEDHFNCKPNYLSLMSYSLQWKDIDKKRPLDYSRLILTPLNETSLSEPAGVGGPATRQAVWGVGGGAAPRHRAANLPLDWNNDGDAIDLGVSGDINLIPVAGCGIPDGLIAGIAGRDRIELRSQNDWVNLLYDLRLSLGVYDDGATIRPAELKSPQQEKTEQEGVRAAAASDYDEDGIPNSVDNCPGDPNPDQKDADGNGIGDVCEVGIAPMSNLAVTLTDTPDPVVEGSTLTYVAAISNLGPASATGITLTDNLPAGVTLLTVSPSQGSCTGTTAITCNLGTLATGSLATVAIVVRPVGAAVRSNKVEVAGGPGDPDLTNNSASVSTTVTAMSMPGDLNKDGKVDCVDLGIVRGAFGKTAGQPGFDVRADVVTDGIIDIRDLAYVSLRLPAGTRCP